MIYLTYFLGMPVEGVCMEMIERIGVVDTKHMICAKMHMFPKGTFSAGYVRKIYRFPYIYALQQIIIAYIRHTMANYFFFNF